MTYLKISWLLLELLLYYAKNEDIPKASIFMDGFIKVIHKFYHV